MLSVTKKREGNPSLFCIVFKLKIWYNMIIEFIKIKRRGSVMRKYKTRQSFFNDLHKICANQKNDFLNWLSYVCNYKLYLINGYKEIEDYTFSNCKWENLKLPNTIETIGSFAFYNNQLEKVEIPNSVTEIGNAAFCKNRIKSIKIPSSIKEIDVDAFADNNLKEVVIPDSVEIIKKRAFQNNKIKNILIPKSVKKIETEAFAWNNIKNVFLPKTTYVENGAFDINVRINYVD